MLRRRGNRFTQTTFLNKVHQHQSRTRVRTRCPFRSSQFFMLFVLRVKPRPLNGPVHISCLHQSARCVEITWLRARRERRGHTRRETAGCATVPRASAGSAADGASVWSRPVPWRTDRSRRGPRSRYCSSHCGRRLETKQEQEISSYHQTQTLTGCLFI